MECERCRHTIASDSPVWCQECHDTRITDVREEVRGEILSELLFWAHERHESEVGPDPRNIRRQALDDIWTQVIREIEAMQGDNGQP
jgi:hypothetical protein